MSLAQILLGMLVVVAVSFTLHWQANFRRVPRSFARGVSFALLALLAVTAVLASKR